MALQYLTTELLGDMRADLASDSTVFTDDELDRIYYRSNLNYPQAMIIAIDQLMMQAAGDVDIQVGTTREANSQRYDKLEKQREKWVNELAKQAGQFGTVQAKLEPPIPRMRPRRTSTLSGIGRNPDDLVRRRRRGEWDW